MVKLSRLTLLPALSLTAGLVLGVPQAQATEEDLAAFDRPDPKPDEEWESYLMPGVRGSLWRPRGHKTYGTFAGASAEFLIASWVHKNENRGPSHGRVYVNFDLLASNRQGVSQAFGYTLGTDLSFERNPRRRFAIPYFGLELGGLVQKQMGHLFQVTPQGGVFIYSGRNLAVTLSGGYLLPVSRDVGDLQGLRAKLGVNFSLW